MDLEADPAFFSEAIILSYANILEIAYIGAKCNWKFPTSGKQCHGQMTTDTGTCHPECDF